MNFQSIDAALRNPKEIRVIKNGKPISPDELSRLTASDLLDCGVFIKGSGLRIGAVYPDGAIAGFGWREVATGFKKRITTKSSATGLLEEAYDLTRYYVNGQWII